MKNVRDLITPESLGLVRAVNAHGSMAAAARELNLVPSAVTYRIRQIEEALDVLLFDRSAKQARITPAGQELLQEGERVLQELDAVARRVQRVATGWEPRLTLAVDSVVSKRVLLELTEGFLSACPGGTAPPTRLRLQTETLSGSWHALTGGEADLMIGGVSEGGGQANIQLRVLGEVVFVFAVAPHHPLAALPEPLPDSVIQQHRIVAIADSSRRKETVSFGILPGQDVLTVTTMPDKLEAQIRGIGCGFVPEQMAKPYLESGRLVAKLTERPARKPKIHYAWRSPSRGQPGLALAWWLKALSNASTREALLCRY
jgi:DNA-binding transcriptional LysR family regulator